MSTGPINNLSSSYLQPILNALQNAGVALNKPGSSALDGTSLTHTDKGQLSPFAQLMSTLQQLQQSDPAKYQQVTQQIATNLQNAAQTAQADGNTGAATQLSQLATDFTAASKSGQLPNIQDLAKAIGGHHHHHHSHVEAADADANVGGSGSSTPAPNTANTSQLNQFLSSLQATGSQSDAVDSMSIIRDTLSKAGISTQNG